MNHRQISKIAVLIALVFAVTIVVYPLIFGTDEQPPDSPPVELELEH